MVVPLKQEVYDAIRQECITVFREQETVPADALMVRLMQVPGVPMHYPYHHFILPAGLLTLAAVETGKPEETLCQELELAEKRAKTVPAGFCGECGTCGSAVGVGLFLCVYTKATPKSKENWQWANEATGRCLQKIAAYPGPRCCKRTTFLALREGVPYLNEKLGLSFSLTPQMNCTFSAKNVECIKEDCPFYKKESITA